jgi:hypothetical protein
MSATQKTINMSGGRIYIYAMRDPRDGLVYYVGSSENLALRSTAHYSSPASMGLRWWIDGLRRDGLRPEIVILEETTTERRWVDERTWIHEYWQQGAPLLNDSMRPENRRCGRCTMEWRAEVESTRCPRCGDYGGSIHAAQLHLFIDYSLQAKAEKARTSDPLIYRKRLDTPL